MAAHCTTHNLILPLTAGNADNMWDGFDLIQIQPYDAIVDRMLNWATVSIEEAKGYVANCT